MNRNLSRVLAGALVLASVGCESVTSPGGTNLSAAEARALAYGMSVQGVDQYESLAFDESGASFDVGTTPELNSSHDLAGLGIWGRFRPGRHGVISATIEVTYSCPQGGTNNTKTTLTSSVDTATKSGSVTTESIITPAACAFAVDSLGAALLSTTARTKVTITGTPNLVYNANSTYKWTVSDRIFGRGKLARGETTATLKGSFDYTTSDGRTGNCAVDIASEFDPETRTHTVTGTACGVTIDITRTTPPPHKRREHDRRG